MEQTHTGTTNFFPSSLLKINQRCIFFCFVLFCSLTVARLSPRIESHPSAVRSLSLCRRYAVALVRLPGPGRVQGATLQHPVDDVGARLLVLVPEQGVHKGVAGCLAVC